MAKKISELEDVTNLSDGCCFPMVSHDETRKLSYGNLKDRLDEDFNFGLLAFKDGVGANEIAFDNSGTSIQATRVDNALKELDADILETQEAIPEMVELTQAEYDALPDSKLTDNIDYYITDADGYEGIIDDEITGEASTWSSEKIDGELDTVKTIKTIDVTVDTTKVSSKQGYTRCFEQNGAIYLSISFLLYAFTPSAWTKIASIPSEYAPQYDYYFTAQDAINEFKTYICYVGNDGSIYMRGSSVINGATLRGNVCYLKGK